MVRKLIAVICIIFLSNVHGASGGRRQAVFGQFHEARKGFEVSGEGLQQSIRRRSGESSAAHGKDQHVR